MVCPFDAISFKETHRAKYGRDVAYKCDLCHERIKKNQQPACVKACHSNALTFREYDPLRRDQAIKNLRVYLLGEGKMFGIILGIVGHDKFKQVPARLFHVGHGKAASGVLFQHHRPFCCFTQIMFIDIEHMFVNTALGARQRMRLSID